MKRWIALAAAACWAISGCKVGPNYVPPSPTVPAAWSQPPDPRVAVGAQGAAQWWRVFDDPILDRLMAETAAQNLSLQEAGLRILAARAQRGVVAGDRFPDLAGTASYSRNQISGNGNPFGLANVPGIPFDISKPFDLFSTGFDATWELDIFGRLRRAVEAADAEIGAAVQEHNDLLVTLLSEVAANYVRVRTLQERLQIAERNVQIQRETLRLTQERHRVGTVSQLDVAQALTNLRNTEALVPGLRSQLRAANNRLCVLRAQYPHDLLEELGGARPIPSPPLEVAVGLPADLVRQRPDVRRAEREMAAQSARVGVAVADLYPQVSLTGTFTVDAVNLSSLFTPESTAFRLFGPSIRWQILNFGRVRSRIRVQEARLQAAMIRYEQTLLQAVEEVENALASYVEQQARVASLAQAVEAAKQAEQLARQRYLKGQTSFQSLLDAQRFLLLVEEQHVAGRSNVALSLVALYKALGGGWQANLSPPCCQPDPAAQTPAGATQPAPAPSGGLRRLPTPGG